MLAFLAPHAGRFNMSRRRSGVLHRHSRLGGDLLLLQLLMMLLLLLRRVALQRRNDMFVLDNVVGVVAQTIRPREGVDETASLDGAQANHEGLVEESVAGLGDDLISDLVQISLTHPIDQLVLSRQDDFRAKGSKVSLNGLGVCAMHGDVHLNGCQRCFTSRAREGWG